MKKITHEMRVKAYACRAQRAVFRDNFSNGMPVSVENVFILASLSFTSPLSGQRRGLSLWWLLHFLSSAVGFAYTSGARRYFRPTILREDRPVPDKYNEDLTLLATLLMEAPEPK